VVADEVLSCSPEILSYFNDRAFGLVIFYKFRRITRVNKILKFVTFYKLMPAHEIEVNLILLVFSKQKLSKNLNLRQILNPVVHQLAYKIQIQIFELDLRKLSTDEILLFFGLLYFVMFEMEITELRKRGGCSFV
jgi:hypothetical protein